MCSGGLLRFSGHMSHFAWGCVEAKQELLSNPRLQLSALNRSALVTKRPDGEQGIPSPGLSAKPPKRFSVTTNGITQSPSSGNAIPIVFTREGNVYANSGDVAAFFEKRHKDVLEAVDNLLLLEPSLRERHFRPTQNSLEMPTGGHRTVRAFEMNRDGFTLLGMGFTGAKALQWKLRYIAAFNAMEAQLLKQTEVPNLQDPKQLLKLLTDYANKAIELEAQVDELRPAAKALDRIAVADGSLNITNAAKTLQVKPGILFDYLRAKGWIYKRLGTNLDVGYQDKIDAGLLEHKIHTVTKPDGGELVKLQVRVTPKGLARLAKELKD